MHELTLFTSCFILVFALGAQSLNVNNGHYLAAGLTSFAIGAGAGSMLIAWGDESVAALERMKDLGFYVNNT